MHNATVQQHLTTVSPNSNPIIIMLKAEEEFVSKHKMSFHSVVHVRRSSHRWWLRTPVVSSQALAGGSTVACNVRPRYNASSLHISLPTTHDRSFPTLADGAKYSLSSRGKSRLQISTLRSLMELTDSNCSRQEVKADCRYPHCDHLWSSQIPTALVESIWLGTRAFAVLPISPRCHIEF
ncbi:hypothetical protein TNCV_3230681 [Trichonephila clavipes]|nr:hypothetical protein TNCV_3230681 [Trichonephila clavipes]